MGPDMSQIRRFILCPGCREPRDDLENHPTGISLCNECSAELAQQLADEKAGQLVTSTARTTNWTAFREAETQAEALRRIMDRDPTP